MAVDLRGNGFNGGHALANGLDIAQFQKDLAPGALAAGLHAGLPRKHHHQVFADLQKGLGERPLKALAVGEQQHQRNHTPDDAEHRERGAHAVMAKRSERLFENMTNHSYLKASTGVSREARRAG